jgi:NTE family protein
MASGSLPPGFPMTEIDGEAYIDGGVFSNTPLDMLIEMLDEDEVDRLPIFVIDLFPATDATPKNLVESQNRMKEITYENRIAAEFGGAEGLAQHGAMVRDLAASLKGNARLARNPALRALLRQRAYANVQVVNAPHAPFSGDHDFSRDGVTTRRDRGRAAAEVWLRRVERKAKAA